MKPSIVTRVVLKLLRPIAKYLWPILPGSSLGWGPPRRYSTSYSNWLANVSTQSQASLSPVVPSLQFRATSSVTLDTKLPKNLTSRACITLEPQLVA